MNASVMDRQQLPPRRETDALFGAPLTPRQRNLVHALLEGLTNREIAKRFGTREQTVKNQLSALFRKLGVASRLQLATLPAPALRALLRDEPGTSR
jgi:DNA-binding NarL/FixJ family response regulator